MSFFAVYIPNDSPTAAASEKSGGGDESTNRSPMVFKEMSQVEETIKKYKEKNPRFKKFSSYDLARRFAMDGGYDESSSSCSSMISGDNLTGSDQQRPSTPRPPPASPTPAADELPRPFPAPTRPELTNFKKAIESKNIEKLRRLIDENPRYLINCNGDTPTILQEGFRYNALHVATRTGHLESLQAILPLFQDESSTYVCRLYPDDQNEETTSNRRRLLLDFYLNTPDKGFNDTPLHFAAKKGFVDLVKYLCSFKECQRTLVNKNGQTPKDLVEENEDISKKLKKEILHLLEFGGPIYYIPLYRARDEAYAPILRHPTIGFPDTDLKSEDNPELKGVDYRLAAYIGPVDKDVAENLYTQWSSNDSSNSPKKENKATKKSSKKLESAKISTTASSSMSIKRSDLHKGMERIGRQLATKGNYGWMEYWNFLRIFIDLKTETGLNRLEEYFRQKSTKAETNFEILNKTLESSFDERTTTKDVCRRKLDFTDSDKEDEDDSSKDSSDLYFDANEEDEKLFLKSPRSPKIHDDSADSTRDGFFTPPQELTANVIFGQEPSKLDRDVFATLENVKIDEEHFPQTAAWLKMIREYSDEERGRWVPLDSPRSASAIRQKMAYLRTTE